MSRVGPRSATHLEIGVVVGRASRTLPTQTQIFQAIPIESRQKRAIKETD